MVRAGAPLSLSGRFAVQGEQARRGLRLWAEDVTSTGGLVVGPDRPPEPLELLIDDDGSRRAGAADATERLIVEDRVDLLFGPYGSVLTIAAAEVAERYGRVLWNHGGSSDAVATQGWRRVVTLLSPASRYFEPVLEAAIERAADLGRPFGRLALLHGAAGTFPAAVAAGARSRARGLGLELVFDVPYPDESELPAVVRRLADRRPDLVLGVGTTEADLAFARAVTGRRLDSALVGLVAAPIQRFAEVLGGDADGFCGPSQWEPARRDRPDLGPTSARFAAAFRARFGVEPDYPAAQAYAAGLVAARCVETAGSFDDAALRGAADALDLTTFYGGFRLDPASGEQVGHELVVVQWQARRKAVVWPPTIATAPLQLPLPTAAPTLSPPDEPSSYR
jgi:branched-chain amino acid transport system substrate-binding protein